MLRKQFNSGDYACAAMRSPFPSTPPYALSPPLVTQALAVASPPIQIDHHHRDAHLPACLLKLWLRDLSEALIPDYY
jgi:hypothetical protein